MFQADNLSFLALNFTDANLNIPIVSDPAGNKFKKASLQWIGVQPYTTLPFCDFINITNNEATDVVWLPSGTNPITNAVIVENGNSCVILNSGDKAIQIANSIGSSVLANNNPLLPGNAVLCILLNASANSWSCIDFSNTNSLALVASMAGSGLSPSADSKKLDATFKVVQKTTNSLQSVDDRNCLIAMGASSIDQNLTYTLAVAKDLGNGFYFAVRNNMITQRTVTVQTSKNKNTGQYDVFSPGQPIADSGASQFTLSPGQSVSLVSDGVGVFYAVSAYSIGNLATINNFDLKTATSGSYTMGAQAAISNIQSFADTGGAASSYTIYYPAGFGYIWFFLNNTAKTIKVGITGNSDNQLITLPPKDVDPTKPVIGTFAYSNGTTISLLNNLTIDSLQVTGDAIFNGTVYLNGILTTTQNAGIEIMSGKGVKITQGNIQMLNGIFRAAGTTAGIYIVPDLDNLNNPDYYITEEIKSNSDDYIQPRKVLYGGTPLLELHAIPTKKKLERST